MSTTVISSSICRDFLPSRHLSTQVYPGCTTSRLLHILQRSAFPSRPPRPGQRDVDFKFKNFIIYIGGNDLSEGVPVDKVIRNIEDIIDVIQTANRTAKVKVSAVLPRPREKSTAHHVRELNQCLKYKLGKMYIGSYLVSEAVHPELEHKAKKVGDRVSENLHIISNEPSLAFFRIQEHVRKSLPNLVEKKHEVQSLQQQIQGSCFDMDYAINAVGSMQQSVQHFQNIQDLLKNAMFMKQQLQYEQSRRNQERLRPSMYRTIVRTQTVDIAVAGPGPSESHPDFTTSVQLPSPGYEDGSPRARSASLSSQTHRPAGILR